jgi:hypothetical protein
MHSCILREMMITVLRASMIACVLLSAAASAAGNDRVGSLQEAIEQVQRETSGRVLSADVVRAGPRELYRIKVLTPDGRVRVLTKSTRGSRR